MRYWIVALVSQLSVWSAVVLMWLSNEWMTVGYGLNPWLGIPLAVLLVGIPLVLALLLDERHLYGEEEENALQTFEDKYGRLPI